MPAGPKLPLKENSHSVFREIKTGFYDLLHIFYPSICAACGQTLFQGEKFLCRFCYHSLPKTHSHRELDNPLRRIFWGRLEVRQANSFLFFDKKSRVQNLMHRLKYRGEKELAEFLGKLYSSELKQSAGFLKPDLIIPVPLHPAKKAIRGYNQSEEFAVGLGDGLGVPVKSEILIRTQNTATQTKKGRMDRWENVKNVFQVKKQDHVSGKVVMLVDDVITTGATLEACGHQLQNAGASEIDLLTLACTVSI
jgi:ComF family protein